MPGSGVACAFNRVTVEIVKLLKNAYTVGEPLANFFWVKRKRAINRARDSVGEPMAIFATVGNEWTRSGYVGVVYPEMQISSSAVVEVFRGEIKAIRA